MTTDDLRTRAERAAAVEYMEFSSDDFETRAQTAALRAAFIEGYLAHAAQQPTREQLARALMMVRGSYLLTEGGEPSPMPGDYRCADAVLDLLDGADGESDG